MPGPYAPSHRRTSSARASSAGSSGRPPGSQVSMGDQRNWLLVQEPRGRPRTMRPWAAGTISTRLAMAGRAS